MTLWYDWHVNDILNQEKMSQVICLERSNLPLTPTALKASSNSQLWCHFRFNPRSSVNPSRHRYIIYVVKRAFRIYILAASSSGQHLDSTLLHFNFKCWSKSYIKHRAYNKNFHLNPFFLDATDCRLAKQSNQEIVFKHHWKKIFCILILGWVGKVWRAGGATSQFLTKKKLLLYNSNAPTIHILSSVQDEPRNWMIVQAWRIVGEPSSPYIAYLYYSFLHLIQHTTPLLLSLICSHGIC